MEPTCGWCRRNSRSCVYRARQKPGFRAGYVGELEAKINHLEAHINHLEAVLQVSGTGVESDICLHCSTTEVSAHPWDVASPGESQDLPQLVSSRSGGIPGLVPWTVLSAPNGVLATTAIEVPTYGQLYSLVDLYFKHVNTWCPILDRKTTIEACFGVSPPDDPDRVLLWAMVAVSLRFSHDSCWTPETRRRVHALAREEVLLQSLETPSVKSLQALVIMAWDILGASEGPQSSGLLAMIVQNAIQMRLHLENGLSLVPGMNSPPGRLPKVVLPQPTSWLEDEGRRRLFWMVYALERYAAVSLGSDFVLREDEVARQLPCRYDLFSKNQPVETGHFSETGPCRPIVRHPENLGSFSYHCEVLRVLSRIQLFVRKPVDICSLAEMDWWRQTYRELDEDLNSWLANLPSEYSRVSLLCHSDPTSRVSNWIMLHAAFVTSAIRLHSCAAYPAVRCSIFMASHSASQRCLAAVESLRLMAQEVYQAGTLDLLGPNFAFSLWTATRLLLVHAASTRSEVDPCCENFVFILGQMGQFWPLAGQYARLLDNVWKRSLERRSSPPSFVPTALLAMRR